MLLIYNLATRLYFILIRVASAFSPKAKKLYSGQRAATSELRNYFDTGTDMNPIWIHAASLGEFEQGRPIIESIKSQYPKTKILLTFFSPSGYEVRKNYSQADIVTYLPFDTPANAKAFLDITRPQLAIFVKYEFWYHYISAAHAAKVPLISISTIFKPSQPFFKFYGALHRSMLVKFDHFFVQNDQSLHLLQSIGVANGIVSGDTRYDRVIDISAKQPDLAIIDQFIGDERVIVVGSSWPSDIDLIKDGLHRAMDSAKIIIAPHNVDEVTVSDLLDEFPGSVCYSGTQSSDLTSNRVMVIDNVGMLSSLYGYADIAYVGGGARGALHNTLEPATWGIPIIFARHEKNNKFEEALDLMQNGGAFEVSTAEDFNSQLILLLSNQDKREAAGTQARKQVQDNAGATRIIMNYLINKIDV
ncbi:MAG: glycosyltransferase N-terminal domain-containing protein [Cyclobacteriaceae bacterium]